MAFVTTLPDDDDVVFLLRESCIMVSTVLSSVSVSCVCGIPCWVSLSVFLWFLLVFLRFSSNVTVSSLAVLSESERLKASFMVLP